MKKALLLIILLIAISTAIAWALSGSDDFNRGDSAPISGSWALLDPFEVGLYPQIVSEQVIPSEFGCTSVSENLAYFTAFTASNDQSATITLSTFNDPDRQYAGPLLRASGTTAAGTAVYYSFAANRNYASTTEIFKNVNNSYATLASETATTWAATNTITAMITGSNLELKRNGISLLTVSDAEIASGQPGIVVACTTDVSNTAIDNFTATDVAPTGVVARRRPVNWQ